MNLDDDSECKILRAQRVICGWKIDIAAKCRKQMHEGRRTLFWITLPAGKNAPERYGSQNVADLPTLARDTAVIPIGHISLDREDFPEAPGMEPVTSLAMPDGSCLTITTLFVRTKSVLTCSIFADRHAQVLPEFRKYGIATWAMLELERMAQDPRYGSTNCRAVAINTLSERHHDASNPDMVAMWKSIGRPMRPKGTTGWCVLCRNTSFLHPVH